MLFDKPGRFLLSANRVGLDAAQPSNRCQADYHG